MGAVASISGKVGDLGSYLREQREHAKLSLRQLAALAGVSNPYLSQVERGLRKPSAEVLQQIARGLRISAEALYVRAGILEEESRPGVEAAVHADPVLTDRQKRVLLDIYAAFRAENGAVPAPEGATAPEGAPVTERRPVTEKSPAAEEKDDVLTTPSVTTPSVTTPSGTTQTGSGRRRTARRTSRRGANPDNGSAPEARHEPDDMSAPEARHEPDGMSAPEARHEPDDMSAPEAR
jgi:transcriptional regulator with XRE-family HTH domain